MTQTRVRRSYGTHFWWGQPRSKVGPFGEAIFSQISSDAMRPWSNLSESHHNHLNISEYTWIYRWIYYHSTIISLLTPTSPFLLVSPLMTSKFSRLWPWRIGKAPVSCHPRCHRWALDGPVVPDENMHMMTFKDMVHMCSNVWNRSINFPTLTTNITQMYIYIYTHI